MNLEAASPKGEKRAPCSEVAYRLVALGAVLLYYGSVGLEILRTRRMRPGVLERFGRYDSEPLRRLRDHRGPHVWMHATSMGECKVAMTVADELRRREPEVWITVSTSTATGQLVARSAVRPPEMCVYYPLDLPGLVQRAVGRLRPDAYVIVEAEYFPHIVGAIRRRRVPICVVNGSAPRLEGLYGHPRLRPYWCRMLQDVGCFGVIDRTEAEKLGDLQVSSDRVQVVGNVKQAAIKPLESLKEKQEFRRRAGIGSPERIVVAGCTHAGEEAPILKAFESLLASSPECRLVIVPRRLERLVAVEGLVARSRLGWSRHTGGPARPANPVTIVGDYGHLVEWYGVADVAIIGGSFVSGFGGHNPLEALASGARITYGPHMRESDVTRVLEQRGYAVRASCAAELGRALALILAREPDAGQLEYARDVEETGKRAAGAYANLICEMLDRRQRHRVPAEAAAPGAA